MDGIGKRQASPFDWDAEMRAIEAQHDDDDPVITVTQDEARAQLDRLAFPDPLWIEPFVVETGEMLSASRRRYLIDDFIIGGIGTLCVAGLLWLLIGAGIYGWRVVAGGG